MRSGGSVGCALLFCAHIVHSAPLPASQERPIDESKSLSKSSNSLEALNYLEKYGYVPAGRNNLRTEHSLREGIKKFQKFVKAPITGELDDHTLKLMRSKRCGMPDLIDSTGDDELVSKRRRRYSISSYKWDHKEITYAVHNSPSLYHQMPDGGSPRLMALGDVRLVIKQALDFWAAVADIFFTERNPASDDIDINVSFERLLHSDPNAFDGNGAVLAHAFAPGTGIGGDTHFDDDENWTDEVITSAYSNDTSLLVVAAHEFGHALGLYHSDDEGALMFPMYNYSMSQSRQSMLTQDDVYAIQQLYGCQFGNCESKPVPMPTTTLTTLLPTSPPETLPPVPTTTIPDTPTTVSDEPDMCKGDIDAVAMIRSEIFVFKGAYFWRLDAHGNLIARPSKIVSFWPELPQDLVRIDAAYERPLDYEIVFFAGENYYEFSGVQLQHIGRILNLNEPGLPAHRIKLERVSAAFVWEHNGGTFIFDANKRYWRFHEPSKTLEASAYPRRVGQDYWPDIDIDAVFSNHSVGASASSTYFFSGDDVYAWDAYRSVVAPGYPVKFVDFWPHCNGGSARWFITDT